MKQYIGIENYDAVFAGAGIMSVTLATLLHLLDPDLKILILEKEKEAAKENSEAWNNAGTGHSAYSELTYTPLTTDGRVHIEKALQIASQFELSKEFWAFLCAEKILKPRYFIHQVPHISFVKGPALCDFLEKRYEALHAHLLFRGMRFSKNPEQLKKWMPLVMEGRPTDTEMAATFMAQGTDVNFGALTRGLIQFIKFRKNISVRLENEVKALTYIEKEKNWNIKIKAKNKYAFVKAPFIFIGTGGATIHLLEKSGVPEGLGYGVVPVEGDWLICRDRKIARRHTVKVYKMADLGTPALSVPHLDSRVIAWKRELLFGPFAGQSTRFIKNRASRDQARALTLSNLTPMLLNGLHKLPLLRYLLKEVRLAPAKRLEKLRQFYPLAKSRDWQLCHAGRRIQVIELDKKGDTREVGTKLITTQQGHLAALLGESPGASISVSMLLPVLKTCFSQRYSKGNWEDLLKKMMPSYLIEEEELLQENQKKANQQLGLYEDSSSEF